MKKVRITNKERFEIMNRLAFKFAWGEEERTDWLQSAMNVLSAGCGAVRDSERYNTVELSFTNEEINALQIAGFRL